MKIHPTKRCSNIDGLAIIIILFLFHYQQMDYISFVGEGREKKNGGGGLLLEEIDNVDDGRETFCIHFRL